MNIPTITMPKEQAREAFLHYRQALKQKWTEADDALMRGYKALAKSQQVLDLAAVMKKAGCNHLYQPHLALCRADAVHVWFRRQSDGAGRFQMESGWINDRATRRYVDIPHGTFPWARVFYDTTPNYDLIKAQLPSIPPQYRANAALSNYHLLWEAEWQDEPPRDPILLKRLSGMLFAVLASWDLTDLERAVLRGKV